MNKKYCAGYMSGIILLAYILMMNSLAYALPLLPPGMPDGGCWSDPVNVMTAKIDTGAFSSNNAGGTLTTHYSGDAYKNTWCYSESGRHTARFNRVETDLSSAGPFDQYLKLTDDVDVKIYINSVNYAFYVPIKNSQQAPPGEDAPGPGGNGITSMGMGMATAGNSGLLTFRLRRDIVGGGLIIPSGIELLRFYRYVYSEKYPTRPIFQINTPGMIIPTPAECQINHGQKIMVTFGDIDRSLLTANAASSPYHMQKPLTYKCNTSLTQDIKVTLVATPAGYADAIKTTNPDIGVVMSHNGRTVAPGNNFSSRLVNGQGSDDVKFTVVKNPAAEEIATGQFTNNDTVLIISTL